MKIEMEALAWPMDEPFAISRGIMSESVTILVTLIDEQSGYRGRGEAVGVIYKGETPASMAAQIEAIRPSLETGLSREALQDILPPGGARCAVDAALWDLEAKRSNRSIFDLVGLDGPRPVESAYTIGIRSIFAYRQAAEERSRYAILKVKVNGDNAIEGVKAVRAGAPAAKLIVDPNQAWTIDDLKALAPQMVDMGVILLEQPIPVGMEDALDGIRLPVAICADELIDDERDLPKARGRFDVINIKLDKTGGLTSALRLADEAARQGFRLMVGCMAGSSLCMAPGLVLAHRCEFVDLDGPLLQAKDWSDGLIYADGLIKPMSRTFWG